MKIMHNNGFSKDECQGYRETVHGNLLKAIKALTEAARNFDIPLEEPDNIARADKVMEIDDEMILTVQKIWSPDFAHDIEKLWKDHGIQKTFARRNEFQLDDSTQYYMNDLERISKLDYVPTQEDVLRTRVKTTGVVEMQYKFKDQQNRVRVAQMMDVGGQRNERKKWIHCFEGVGAVIFVVAVSEYNQKCYEDGETPRLTYVIFELLITYYRESLDLFADTVNSKWFVDTPIILFLNKTDIFNEKIKQNPLTDLFPDYTGGSDPTEALDFIKNKFMEKNKYKNKPLACYATAATETKSLQSAFDAITNILSDTKPAKVPE
jgi:GTPase SAR1 family protein